jgi:hypothetical protein
MEVLRIVVNSEGDEDKIKENFNVVGDVLTFNIGGKLTYFLCINCFIIKLK